MTPRPDRPDRPFGVDFCSYGGHDFSYSFTDWLKYYTWDDTLQLHSCSPLALSGEHSAVLVLATRGLRQGFCHFGAHHALSGKHSAVLVLATSALKQAFCRSGARHYIALSGKHSAVLVLATSALRQAFCRSGACH